MMGGFSGNGLFEAILPGRFGSSCGLLSPLFVPMEKTIQMVDEAK